MELIQFICLFASLCVLITANPPCDRTRCRGWQKLYKEMRCAPVTVRGQCCPIRYNCPDYTKLDSKKCHFKNQVYSVGSRLPSYLTEPLCSSSCFCRKFPNRRAEFICAQIECPEVFNRNPYCIYPVKEGKCCTSNKVCGDGRKKLAKCYMSGRKYYEGETMFPKTKSCHSCKCTKNFNNSTIIGNPNCKEIDCGIQLTNMPRLQKGCVPIYFKDEHCCPIGWRCPEDSDFIIGKSNKQKLSRNTCKFGKLLLNVGDQISNTENGVKCSCVAPPFVQCIRSK